MTLCKKRAPRGAFTLVEMLVAMAVLALMIVLVAQLVSDASGAIHADRKRMDADSQARLVLDRLAQDFARMPQRGDVDVVFSRRTGNDKLFFYSEAAGISTASAAERSTQSLIGFRVATGTDGLLQFERLGKGLTWRQAGSSPNSMAYLTYDANGALLPGSTIPGRWPDTLGTAPAYEGTDPDYLVLGEQVFRFEYCFLLRDGTFSNAPAMNLAGSDLAANRAPAASDGGGSIVKGSRWFDTQAGRAYRCVDPTPGAAVWTAVGMEDIAAIVVSLGILDSTSRDLVSSLAALVEELPDTTAADLAATPPRLMAETWGGRIAAIVGSPPVGMPVQAASQVRFYQRFFYLNQN